MTVEEILETAKKIDSKNLADCAILKVLNQMDDESLQSDAGRELVKLLVACHIHPNRLIDRPFFLEFEFDFDRYEFWLDEYLVQSSPTQVIELCNRSKLFEREIEILDFVLSEREQFRRFPPESSNVG